MHSTSSVLKGAHDAAQNGDNMWTECGTSFNCTGTRNLMPVCMYIPDHITDGRCIRQQVRHAGAHLSGHEGGGALIERIEVCPRPCAPAASVSRLLAIPT